MYRHLLLFAVLLLSLTRVEAQDMDIIPSPCSVVQYEGSYLFTTPIWVEYQEEELEPLVDYLSSYIPTYKANISCNLKLNIDYNLTTEEYRLDVSPLGVTISGGGYGGVFNAIQTLFQLLPASVYSKRGFEKVELPYCTIKDSPRYPHRGFMLDVCRTWMDKESVMEYIDLLSYHKINSFRLHLTDDEAWRIEIKSHPELAELGGFRGGDSPIWPRYGKWNERWGGYYTQDDMREIIEYARVRNIEVVPEIDLPGHSLCIATLHPEILCNYKPRTSASFGYDTRSVFCASREENYALIEDILAEVCELFPSKYIHIGGDEVDMSQWRKCPNCTSLMAEHKMNSTEELQQHFMLRLTDILSKYGKYPAVWNESIDGGRLDSNTLVYGWESVKACRESAAKGYKTVVMPGQYFYFDMKQSPREDGHDWAAIFDWNKTYSFTLSDIGFTPEEQRSIVGFEASFFSELYASHIPETPDYLHYMTFPRMLALSEIAWCGDGARCKDEFHRRIVAHYDRMDAMGIAYRIEPPKVEYNEGVLSVDAEVGCDILCYNEQSHKEIAYNAPIETNTPASYSFIACRAKAHSPRVAHISHFHTIKPRFTISSSMDDSERFSFEKAQGYGRLARTTRAADVGDWIMFTFDIVVECRRMKVATGNFQLPRYIFENGYVEVSYDGQHFEYVGDLDGGICYIEEPQRPIKAVKMVCTSRGNGAEWVSIQPPTIYPKL